MSPWQICLERLEGELSPQLFNTWIRPLQAIEEEHGVRLLAPNRFVKDWVSEQYLNDIQEHLHSIVDNNFRLQIEVGSQNNTPAAQQQKLLKRRQSKNPSTPKPCRTTPAI